MITALTFPGEGGRVVTRAKKFMSVLIRGQGSVPDWPIPSWGFGGEEEDEEGEEGGGRIGVVATIRVRGGRAGGGGGILGGWIGWCVGRWFVGR